MENNNESFSDQMQALVFKIRTGCVQLVKLLKLHLKQQWNMV